MKKREGRGKWKGGEGKGAQGWEGKFRGSGGRRERGREKGRGGKIYGGGAGPPNIFS